MEKVFNSDIQLPPGFKFHPSDEELIIHYLRNKATSNSQPASVIAEVDLYKCNPWDLPSKALFGEEEWYFYTPRDRKYPNGNRPNRMAGSGYWKATGTDKPILSSQGSTVLGVKKGLVFYKGRSPGGEKTGWIMHEYRLPETTILPSRQKDSMRLDDWVLCRVRQKSNVPKNRKQDPYALNSEPCTTKGNRLCTTSKNNKLDIVRDFLYRDCLVLPLILATQDLPSLDTISSLSFEPRKCTSSSAGEVYSSTSMLQKTSMPIDNGEKKRRPSEGGEWHESVIHPTKKQFYKDDQWSNTAAEPNFCGAGGQYEGNVSNSSEWSYINQYQELNRSTLAEEDFSLLR